MIYNNFIKNFVFVNIYGIALIFILNLYAIEDNNVLLIQWEKICSSKGAVENRRLFYLQDVREYLTIIKNKTLPKETVESTKLYSCLLMHGSVCWSEYVDIKSYKSNSSTISTLFNLSSLALLHYEHTDDISLLKKFIEGMSLIMVPKEQIYVHPHGYKMLFWDTIYRDLDLVLMNSKTVRLKLCELLLEMHEKKISNILTTSFDKCGNYHEIETGDTSIRKLVRNHLSRMESMPNVSVVELSELKKMYNTTNENVITIAKILLKDKFSNVFGVKKEEKE